MKLNLKSKIRHEWVMHVHENWNHRKGNNLPKWKDEKLRCVEGRLSWVWHHKGKQELMMIL